MGRFLALVVALLLPWLFGCVHAMPDDCERLAPHIWHCVED